MARQKIGEQKPTLDDALERIQELERTVKALLLAVKDAEEQLESPIMPEGEYYGEKFED